MLNFDALIIGGGIVGLAIAKEISESGRSVALIEKNDYYCAETSARNSEVIHSGIYYKPGSLKASLCMEGSKKLYEYLEAKKINFNKCGKLIFSNTNEEKIKLDQIFHRGNANKVSNICLLEGKEVLEIEPNLRCKNAIHVKNSGVFDSHGFMEALISDIEKNDGIIVRKSNFLHAHKKNNEFIVSIDSGERFELKCRYLINSAGLHSDKVAKNIKNLNKKYIPKLTYSKGTYYSTNLKSKFSSLIYPVPDRDGLGIHLTTDLTGKVKFGPDAEIVDSLDYSLNDNKKHIFLSAIKRFWPDIEKQNIFPDYCGIRPKISQEVQNNQDFLIQTSQTHSVKNLINLYGIESPGLTSSLAIGALIRSYVVK